MTIVCIPEGTKLKKKEKDLSIITPGPHELPYFFLITKFEKKKKEKRLTRGIWYRFILRILRLLYLERTSVDYRGVRDCGEVNLFLCINAIGIAGYQ